MKQHISSDYTNTSATRLLHKKELFTEEKKGVFFRQKQNMRMPGAAFALVGERDNSSTLNDESKPIDKKNQQQNNMILLIQWHSVLCVLPTF